MENSQRRSRSDCRAESLIISTRAALGAGLGLLAGAALSRRERRLVGLALIAIGAVTTVPAVLAIRRSFTASGTREIKPSSVA